MSVMSAYDPKRTYKCERTRSVCQQRQLVAALMTGVQRAISLVTNDASGC